MLSKATGNVLKVASLKLHLLKLALACETLQCSQLLETVSTKEHAVVGATGGALTFSCGLHIGSPLEGTPTCLVVPGGALQDGKLQWPAEPVKFFVPGAAVMSLKVTFINPMLLICSQSTPRQSADIGRV